MQTFNPCSNGWTLAARLRLKVSAAAKSQLAAWMLTCLWFMLTALPTQAQTQTSTMAYYDWFDLETGTVIPDPSPIPSQADFEFVSNSFFTPHAVIIQNGATGVQIAYSTETYDNVLFSDIASLTFTTSLIDQPFNQVAVLLTPGGNYFKLGFVSENDPIDVTFQWEQLLPTQPCSPVITTAEPKSLWPPNHKYQTITVAQCVVSVSGCAGLSVDDVVITQVTSDEPEDARGCDDDDDNGDGRTRNDIVIAANCKSVRLRAERDGSKNGRVYTITLKVQDVSGNVATATCAVTVPKRKKGTAVDDGAVYIVNSRCGSSATKVSSAFSEENSTVATLPEAYALEQNYPNPFNPSTTISFALPEAGTVTVAVYSITGQLVRELVNREMPAGRHAISWDGRDQAGNTVAAGIYLYRLVAHGENGEAVFTQTRRMAFVK